MLFWRNDRAGSVTRNIHAGQFYDHHGSLGLAGSIVFYDGYSGPSGLLTVTTSAVSYGIISMADDFVGRSAIPGADATRYDDRQRHFHQ